MKILCILVIIVSQIYENDSKIQARIIGGERSEFPFAALLTYQGKIHCGATILSNQILLTAAHCVDGYNRAALTALMHKSKRFIKATEIHESFNDTTLDNDIALLRLNQPVMFDSKIQPVCLPFGEPNVNIGTIIGWGYTSEGGRTSHLAQYANVYIYTREQCKNMKYEVQEITENMMCADARNHDTCQGDSGGPLLVRNNNKYEVVGITSWGDGCGHPGYPGIYTRVINYLPWICKKLDKYMNTACLCHRNTTKKCDQCGKIYFAVNNEDLEGTVYAASSDEKNQENTVGINMEREATKSRHIESSEKISTKTSLDVTNYSQKVEADSSGDNRIQLGNSISNSPTSLPMTMYPYDLFFDFCSVFSKKCLQKKFACKVTAFFFTAISIFFVAVSIFLITFRNCFIKSKNWLFPILK